MNEQHADLFLSVSCAVLFCAVFASLIFYSFRRSDNDERTRYRKQFLGFVIWAIVLVASLINAVRHKGLGVQSVFLPTVHESTFDRLRPFLACVFAGIGLVLYFFGLLKARRKMLEQPGFRRQAKRLPQLFWQACFILLPVAGLACFGLYSLRQDRLLAEQQAREAGEALAQRLAQAISTGAVQPLNDYRDASFVYDANCLADIGVSPWQGSTQSVNQERHAPQIWQQANPEIDLAAMPSVDNGAPYVMTMQPMPPEPPEWLLQLDARQRQLWEAAKESELMSGNSASPQSAINEFIESKPPVAARANAQYLLLLVKTRGLPNRDAAEEFATKWNQSDLTDAAQYLTEAGLPLGQLMCYQALRLTPTGAGVPDGFVQNIFWVTFCKHSFFSVRLIAEAERAARGTESEQKVAALRAWFERRQKSLQVLDDFRNQYPENGWKAGAFTVASRHGQFLLFLDNPDMPTNQVPPGLYLMEPRAVVVKALKTAIKQSGISVPDYFQAEFQMGSERINLPNVPSDGTLASTNAAISTFPIFGQADSTWKDLWGLSTPLYPFRIRILLAHPDILYARQRQRTWMFGGLIVASTLAAVSALFAAYRSFRRQQELNEMKINFVSSVSHELRAPIASVRLMAENLERGKIPDAPRQNEYFRFIVQECRRLSSLIENVLDFSRIEQGRKQYEFEPANLVALVQTTVKLMEPYAAEKGVRLEITEAGASNIEMELDSRAIQQALVNLIDNAIKHSPKGETVTTGIESPKGNGDNVGAPAAVLLFVADHGPGIPPEEHEKIFERFYRRGSELRRETQGVGIGLSVVQHIVKAHGGCVRVQSAPGQGSRFTIELPIKTNE